MVKLQMATVDELKSVLKETLNRRGILGQLKARIRTEVFQALDDQSETRPVLSNENLLINELIREYLEFNQYRYTASVLKAESGQPETCLDHNFLKSELNLTEDNDITAMPLLYGMVAHFIQRQNTKGESTMRQPSSDVPHSSRTISVHQITDEKDLTSSSKDKNLYNSNLAV